MLNGGKRNTRVSLRGAYTQGSKKGLTVSKKLNHLFKTLKCAFYYTSVEGRGQWQPGAANGSAGVQMPRMQG
jgi:hypothetical protein